MAESTHLSRTFSDQGVRLRLRKEARSLGGYVYTDKLCVGASLLTTGSNGSSLKRVHGGMSSPPETYTQHQQSAGFGGPVGDAHYVPSYGTPVKRQRSDSGPTNPNTYPAFASNGASLYANNPAMGRSFGSQSQNYAPGQDFMSFNLPQAPAGATLPPSTGPTSGSSVGDTAAWSRPFQQGAMQASASGMPAFTYGRTSATPRPMYFDPQQSRMHYPGHPQSDANYGYGLATPTSNSDNAIGHDQNYAQAQSDFNANAASAAQGLPGQPQFQQDLSGDFDSYEGRSTSGEATGSSLHATAHANTSGLSFDHLPQASGHYPIHGPQTRQESISNLFDVSAGYSSNSGSFESPGSQNPAAMSTLNSEWSGAQYQTQQSNPGQRLPQQTMESFGEHPSSSGYPTPQTSKWPH